MLKHTLHPLHASPLRASREVIRAAGGTQEFYGVQEVDFVTVRGKVDIVYGNFYRGFRKVSLEHVGWAGMVRIWSCSDQV
ncbi:hypothetical protein RUND412_003457 [Rhizina undulata]